MKIQMRSIHGGITNTHDFNEAMQLLLSGELEKISWGTVDGGRFIIRSPRTWPIGAPDAATLNGVLGVAGMWEFWHEDYLLKRVVPVGLEPTTG